MESIDVFDKIVDSLDIETFIICQSEKEGRRIGLAIMEKLGLQNAVSGWDQKNWIPIYEIKKRIQNLKKSDIRKLFGQTLKYIYCPKGQSLSDFDIRTLYVPWYESDNPDIATVDNSGTIKGVTNIISIAATITVSYSEEHISKSDTILVVVNPPFIVFEGMDQACAFWESDYYRYVIGKPTTKNKLKR